MGFCTFSSEHIVDSYTLIDNIFLSEYLPDAPPVCTQVYLYGLYLCGCINGQDNNISIMCRVLDLDEDDILNAYTYWENLGLVCIIHKKPFEIQYMPLKPVKSGTIVKKIKPGKYADFNKQIQGVISGRMISPHEYNEYYGFLERSYMESEALVMIAQYCVDIKGNDINYPYILTVANNMAAGNCKTVETVEQKLATHSKYNKDIEVIFKALGVKREIGFEDRQFFVKWTEEYGFSLSVIKHACKTCKKGGMSKLDKTLTEYYKLKLFGTKEIDSYLAQKQSYYDLAKVINKIIGVYYENLDYIVENYIVSWTHKGFSGETLESVARFCFTHSIRTLEGMNTVIEKFYKLGLVTQNAIDQHIEMLLVNDEIIRRILDQLNLVRNVTTYDRNNYAMWSKNWMLSDELILYAAEQSKDASNPIAYLNKILSNFKDKRITTVEEAKQQGGVAQQSTADTAPNYAKRKYTREELDALFDDIDNLGV